MIRIEWRETSRNAFAAEWPCCDVPETGWFILAENGDLVDISENTRDCEGGGGLTEFIADLTQWI